MRYVRAVDLKRHSRFPQKLAVIQRVPLPDAQSQRPWYDSLEELLVEHYLPRRRR